MPIGNLLSQWLSNLYLNKFDHWIKEIKRVKYFRYSDDIVILHHDKTFLHDLRKQIQAYLRDNLKLELSNYQVFPIKARGIDFVGYVSFHDYIRLRKSIKLRWKKMLKRNRNEKSIAAYNGWLAHADCINLSKQAQ